MIISILRLPLSPSHSPPGFLLVKKFDQSHSRDTVILSNGFDFVNDFVHCSDSVKISVCKIISFLSWFWILSELSSKLNVCYSHFPFLPVCYFFPSQNSLPPFQTSPLNLLSSDWISSPLLLLSVSSAPYLSTLTPATEFIESVITES